MTLSFLALLVVFGWLLSIAVSHYTIVLERHDLAGHQRHVKLALTTFMFLLLPAVAAGAWLVVGRTLHPLRSLSRQADELNATRLVSPSSDQEMIELVTTINHLLDRIEATADAKSRFYAAASHELRTPLQALNGHIETALSRERESEGYRLALVEAQKQTQRLTALTRDVLMLHQLQGQQTGSDERADLAESVRLTLDALSPLAEARGLELSCDVPASVNTRGRQSYSDVCVRNLLENAVRYASPGGRVSVVLKPSVLTISNDCDLAETVDLEAYFEPFGAPSGAEPKPNGNGLGLAVCKAAAHANGWSVSIDTTEGSVVAHVLF